MGGMDIDSLLKDLDEKFKELDRKEAEKKQVSNNPLFSLSDEVAMPKKKVEPIAEERLDKNPFSPLNSNNTIIKPIENNSVEELKVEPKVEEKKPIINVDSDSKVIDDNVISDDEFFDDFFGDDDE